MAGLIPAELLCAPSSAGMCGAGWCPKGMDTTELQILQGFGVLWGSLGVIMAVEFMGAEFGVISVLRGL